MSRRVDSDLLLVGSLPVKSSEEAFRLGSKHFGDLVPALPDGETGARRAWVGYESFTLVEPNPGVEIVKKTTAKGGMPRHIFESTSVAVKDDLSEIHFESWPRIDDALESYKVFKQLKEDGVVPSEQRFQIGLPFPQSAMYAFTPNFAHDFPIASKAYEDLIVREIGRLLEEIPATELAIQWDMAFETKDVEDVLSWTSGDAWDRFAGPVTRLTPEIPEDVLVGYHLCYGTWPEWPMYEPDDYSVVVKMANFAMANSGRPVDWLHLAGPRVLRSEDKKFYEPLSDLKAPDTRVFLGLIQPIDGLDGLQRRHRTASHFIDDFGVAMYCGMGREPDTNGDDVMKEHAEIARSVS